MYRLSVVPKRNRASILNMITMVVVVGAIVIILLLNVVVVVVVVMFDDGDCGDCSCDYKARYCPYT